MAERWETKAEWQMSAVTEMERAQIFGESAAALKTQVHRNWVAADHKVKTENQLSANKKVAVNQLRMTQIGSESIRDNRELGKVSNMNKHTKWQ